ncbi:MAG: hypothetical protein FWD61_02855 [Phycisphaerales bacterium]|nr:hypothetical protein [Phycisphaerales bacterium]
MAARLWRRTVLGVGEYCGIERYEIQAAEMSDVEAAESSARRHTTRLVASVERDVESVKNDVRLIEESVSGHNDKLKTVEANKKKLADLEASIKSQHDSLTKKIDGGGSLQAIFQQVSKEHIERMEKKTDELRLQGESLVKSVSSTVKKQSEAFSITVQQATADGEKMRTAINADATRIREECQKSITHITALAAATKSHVEQIATEATQAISQATANLQQESTHITDSLADSEKKFTATITTATADAFSQLNAVREQSIAELQRQNELNRQSAQTLIECTERLRVQTDANETRLHELGRQGEEKLVASLAICETSFAATTADALSQLNAVRKQSLDELQHQNELNRQSVQTLTECSVRLRDLTDASETHLWDLSRQGEEKLAASLSDHEQNFATTTDSALSQLNAVREQSIAELQRQSELNSQSAQMLTQCAEHLRDQTDAAEAHLWELGCQGEEKLATSLVDCEKKIAITTADALLQLNTARERSIAELQRQNELNRQSIQTLTECTERLRVQTDAAETRLREFGCQSAEKLAASIAFLDQAKAVLAQAQDTADTFQRYHETARWKGVFGRLRWLFFGAPAPMVLTHDVPVTVDL